MTDFIPSEKATSIRNPSTANFAIDSRDRTQGTSTNFLISHNQSLINGFFTRIAVNELVLDYNIPNISSIYQNNTLQIYNVGGSLSSGGTITIPPGFYNIYSISQEILTLLNAGGGIGGINNWTLTLGVGMNVVLANVPGTTFSIALGGLQNQLGLTASATPTATNTYGNPNLQSLKYIDFVSNNLTYNQKLKDNTTNITSKDILYRWVFGWDFPSPTDTWGFPILQGYTPFVARRYLNFPKQIRWEPNMPIGQLQLELFFDTFYTADETINVLSTGGTIEYNMNLLISEV